MKDENVWNRNRGCADLLFFAIVGLLLLFCLPLVGGC